jgi:hypothetical protein
VIDEDDEDEDGDNDDFSGMERPTKMKVRKANIENEKKLFVPV